MLPLSTTRTGTSVFRAMRRPMKKPKTSATTNAMATADFRLSLFLIFASMLLKVVPSLLIL